MSARSRVVDVSLGVLTLCALVVTGLVVRREFTSSRPPAAESFRIRSVEEWRGLTEEGHRRGPRDAPVQILVFSDYQCPYCRVLDERLHRLREEYGQHVAVVYRHFPLGMHSSSRPAALAAECAARQRRFWSLHETMFAQQDSLGRKPWLRLAREAGVPDTRAFERCLERTGPASTVTRDSAVARRLGARGTPTLLINERLYRGALPMEVLRSEIERVGDAD